MASIEELHGRLPKCDDCFPEEKEASLELERATEVIHGYIDQPEGGHFDSESVFVYRLDDGRVGVFSEWSDTSGHG